MATLKQLAQRATLIAVALLSTLSFTSCSSDDDDNEPDIKVASIENTIWISYSESFKAYFVMQIKSPYLYDGIYIHNEEMRSDFVEAYGSDIKIGDIVWQYRRDVEKITPATQLTGNLIYDYLGAKAVCDYELSKDLKKLTLLPNPNSEAYIFGEYDDITTTDFKVGTEWKVWDVEL